MNSVNASAGSHISWSFFWRVFDKILDGMTALAGGLLLFIVAAVCYTIGMRYLFTRTSIWIMQTTEYSLLWIVFLSTTWLLREGGHITTDILYSHLHPKTRGILDCILFVVGGIACTFMTCFALVYLWDCMIHNVTDVRAVTVPKWAVFIIIPIGSLLLTIQFFRMAWDRFAGIERGR